MLRMHRMTRLVVVTLACIGLLITPVSAHKLLEPDWSMDELVQEVHETFLGGTVPAEKMTGNVREFHMYIAEIEHEITEGVTVTAWAYGLEGEEATVPGPTLRVKKGDLVRIYLSNRHDQPHSLHPHGITTVDVLNDGVPHTSGAYIMPGETLMYEFVAQESGTHAYHCHVQTSVHQDMGMYGGLIVEEDEPVVWDREYVAIIDEWDTRRDPTNAAEIPEYNYYVVNGKSGTSVPDFLILDGEVGRIRLINMGFQSHALHLHGTAFVVTHKDGYQLPAPYRGDTINIAPGETYDVLVQGRDGVFPWHDHNSLAATDDGVYPGGMLMHTVGSPEVRFNPAYDPPRYAIEGHVHDGDATRAQYGIVDLDEEGASDHEHEMEDRGTTPQPIEASSSDGETALISETSGRTAPAVARVPMAPMEPPEIVKGAADVKSGIGPAQPFDPVAPSPTIQGEVVEFTLEATRATLEVAPGDVREVWTFNGSVPGPTLRVNQGDTVRFTLINKDPEMAHGLDFHAGQMDPGIYHQAIEPGESITFDWVARYPGVFYYHCSADPVIIHIANGMFGTVIVDPPGYQPADKEYVLVQNEWYRSNNDLDVLLEEKPVAAAFNGVPAQYVDNPLTAVAGESLRFYVVNAGPSDFAAFHVIGGIFDRVLFDGNPRNPQFGVQTVTVPPGGAVVADMIVPDPGDYPVLSHLMSSATKGALGILHVTGD